MIDKNRLKEYETIAKYCENKKTIAIVGCLNYELDFNDYLLGFLKEKFPKKKIIGFDKNKKGIELIRKKNECYEKDFEKPLTLKNKFDLVINVGMLTHCVNIGIVLDNLKKIMKKDGILILGEENLLSSSNFKKILFNEKIHPIRKKGSETKGKHVVSFTIETIQELCKKKGLKIKKTYLFDNYNGILAQIRRIINYFKPELKESFLLILKK